jgi:hypothetical protein
MATTRVTTIDPTQPALTVINVYEVAPEKQGKLVQLLADATEKGCDTSPGSCRLATLREARDRVIDKDHPPASTMAGVQALFRDDVELEIEAEAVIP